MFYFLGYLLVKAIKNLPILALSAETNIYNIVVGYRSLRLDQTRIRSRRKSEPKFFFTVPTKASGSGPGFFIGDFFRSNPDP